MVQSYLRLTSIPVELPFELPENYKLQSGQGATITNGDDLLVIAYGPVMLAEAVKAAEILEKGKVRISVVNFPWLNTVDKGWLKELVLPFEKVLLLDNHYLHGGSR